MSSVFSRRFVEEHFPTGRYLHLRAQVKGGETVTLLDLREVILPVTDPKRVRFVALAPILSGQ